MAEFAPLDYEKLRAEFCPNCRHQETGVCCHCSFDQDFPTLWEKKPETRFELIRTLDTDELAAYLELELGGGVPSDWLTWLTEEAAACE